MDAEVKEGIDARIEILTEVFEKVRTEITPYPNGQHSGALIIAAAILTVAVCVDLR